MIYGRESIEMKVFFLAESDRKSCFFIFQWSQPATALLIHDDMRH